MDGEILLHIYFIGKFLFKFLKFSYYHQFDVKTFLLFFNTSYNYFRL